MVLNPRVYVESVRGLFKQFNDNFEHQRYSSVPLGSTFEVKDEMFIIGARKSSELSDDEHVYKVCTRLKHNILAENVEYLIENEVNCELLEDLLKQYNAEIVRACIHVHKKLGYELSLDVIEEIHKYEASEHITQVQNVIFEEIM